MTEQRKRGSKRSNLVQARLNDHELERLRGLRRSTGLSESALVRAALDGLARRIGEAEPEWPQTA